MASNNLIVKNIIKFKIEYFVCDMVSPKISTVLGQRRINSTEFFDLLKTKIEALNIKKTCKIVFKVFVYVYDIDNYSIFLKMPSVSSLVNHFFLTEKNFTNPGYILRHSIKNIIRIKFNYILTPFLLYEIIKYKYNYERIDDLDLYSYYKKTLSSLRSKGINVYYKGFNKNTSRNYYSKSNLSLINNKRNYSIFSKNSIRYSTFKRNNNRLKLNNNIFLKGNIICYSNFFKKGKSKVIYFIQNSRLFRFIIYLPFFILFYFLYTFFRLFYYIIYKLCTLLIINNTIKINKRYNTSKELNNYDLKESSLKIHEWKFNYDLKESYLNINSLKLNIFEKNFFFIFLILETFIILCLIIIMNIVTFFISLFCLFSNIFNILQFYIRGLRSIIPIIPYIKWFFKCVLFFILFIFLFFFLLNFFSISFTSCLFILIIIIYIIIFSYNDYNNNFLEEQFKRKGNSIISFLFFINAVFRFQMHRCRLKIQIEMDNLFSILEESFLFYSVVYFLNIVKAFFKKKHNFLLKNKK